MRALVANVGLELVAAIGEDAAHPAAFDVQRAAVGDPNQVPREEAVVVLLAGKQVQVDLLAGLGDVEVLDQAGLELFEVGQEAANFVERELAVADQRADLTLVGPRGGSVQPAMQRQKRDRQERPTDGET
jgi:hypothetical protein